MAGRISGLVPFIEVIFMLTEAPAISTEVQVEAAEKTDRLLMEVLAVEVRELRAAAEVVDTVAAEAGMGRETEHLTVIVAEEEVPFLRPRRRMP
jgi:hypothetical protein